jgi:hypothetical protein
MGYGIPDVKKAVQLLLRDYATAAVKDCKTIIWTSKDADGMHYDMERQKEGETGFTKIGTQGSTGGQFVARSYQFTDTSLTFADGPARYRIRQVLDTSTVGFAAFYIDTVTVALALSCTPVPAAAGGVQIVPNPVRNRFYVKVETNTAIENLQLHIVNAIGQTVYTRRTSKEAGIRVISMEAAGLARGVYYLVVYDAKRRLATKAFVKLRP